MSEKDEILKMPAGREMDALIAEKVMGWVKAIRLSTGKPGTAHDLWDTGVAHEKICSWDGSGDYSFIWSPSTNIAAAWDVVENMPQMPGHVGKTMLHSIHNCNGGKWNAVFCSDFGYSQSVSADTAPLAICRAALLAVLEKNGGRDGLSE